MFLDGTQTRYYVNINVENNYGYDVEVRANTDVFEDVVVPAGSQYPINEVTNTGNNFILRIYDRRDGIPILINGQNYKVIAPKSSPQYVYSIVIKPGKFY